MKAEKVIFPCPVTLVGGGELDKSMLDEALAVAPGLVAADGAADRLAAWGHVPEAVIGDMDSISDRGAWAQRTRVVHLPEQETTDFEKCLYATQAPLYVAAGFTGRRVDHMLAVFHALLRRPNRQVLVLGTREAMVMLPPGRVLEVAMAPGAVVSLFPILAARGLASAGLEWPIDGLEFAPGRRIGTSNRATASSVQVGVDAPGVLLMVGRSCLGALARALATQG